MHSEEIAKKLVEGELVLDGDFRFSAIELPSNQFEIIYFCKHNRGASTRVVSFSKIEDRLEPEYLASEIDHFKKLVKKAIYG